MNKCKICGTYVNEDDWLVCEDCRNNAKTFDTAFDIGNSWREEVSINGFLHHCFTQEEIVDILYAKFKSLPEDEQKQLIYSYCEDDMLYFVRWIIQKWKEEQ